MLLIMMFMVQLDVAPPFYVTTHSDQQPLSEEANRGSIAMIPVTKPRIFQKVNRPR